MKLSLTVTDKRQSYSQGYANAKDEDYERVAVIDLTGSRDVLAGFLRAVADDIAPVYTAVEGVEL